MSGAERDVSFFAAPSRRAWIVLGAVLLIRLSLLAWMLNSAPERVLAPDSVTYLGPAQTLLESGRLADSPATPDVPELIRPPG